MDSIYTIAFAIFTYMSAVLCHSDIRALPRKPSLTTYVMISLIDKLQILNFWGLFVSPRSLPRHGHVTFPLPHSSLPRKKVIAIREYQTHVQMSFCSV